MNVHTIVDMINSLMEVYDSDDKNYMYELFGSKILNKKRDLFSNDEVLQLIEEKESKKTYRFQ